MKGSELFPQTAALVAGGLHQLALQRDAEAAMLARFISGQTDLIPLAMLAHGTACMAKDAEPIGARKELAYYEAARAFIRAAKEAIHARALTARNQGTGLPIDVAAWCSEGETLKALEDFMPHPRVMVRVSEARAWIEALGAAVPPLLRLGDAKTEADRGKLISESQPEHDFHRAPESRQKRDPEQVARLVDSHMKAGKNKTTAMELAGEEYRVTRNTIRADLHEAAQRKRPPERQSGMAQLAAFNGRKSPR